MTDLRFTRAPAGPDLRHQLREAVGRLGRPLRVIAEDFGGLESRIDLVAVEPSGRVVLVLIADEGGELERLGDALAQRSWLEPRLRDWMKLAPELDIRPARGVGLLLLVQHVCPRTGAAAAASDVGLARLRFVSRDGGASPQVLLESVRSAQEEAPSPEGDRRFPAPTAPRTESAFRTSLRDADLGLSTAQ